MGKIREDWHVPNLIPLKLDARFESSAQMTRVTLPATVRVPRHRLDVLACLSWPLTSPRPRPSCHPGHQRRPSIMTRLHATLTDHLPPPTPAPPASPQYCPRVFDPDSSASGAPATPPTQSPPASVRPSPPVIELSPRLSTARPLDRLDIIPIRAPAAIARPGHWQRLAHPLPHKFYAQKLLRAEGPLLPSIQYCTCSDMTHGV